MKRTGLVLLILLLGMAVTARAEEELRWLSPTIGGNDAVMIVDNGDDWRVRLNLRAEQRKGSEIRGRVYTGTRVELYQDNGEWCTVGLNFNGGTIITGEVMKQYLTPLEDEFSALCPLAVVKEKIEVAAKAYDPDVQLNPGDAAYVLAVCGEEYFVVIPGKGQGYAPASAFEELKEPEEDVRIVYGTFSVPAGGLELENEYTGDVARLEGGVVLEDCWQVSGASEWNVTFGAGIQRTPRVSGKVPSEKLTAAGEVPFEGKAYAWEKSLIAVVGEINGEPILRRTDENGDVFWAKGKVPHDAVQIENDLYEIRCDGAELLSAAVMENIFEYVSERSVLDERGAGGVVTQEVLKRSKLYAAFAIEPATGELLRLRAWLEDEEGMYVTGGDLKPETGEIIRWGCNG